MPQDASAPLSAQVIVRSASGRPLRGDDQITAETLGAHQPSEAAVNAAQRAFAKAGFEIGPLVGISFSITGSTARFGEWFGVEIERGVDSGLEVRRDGEVLGLELPLNALPEGLSSRLEAVTFTPPAELFGVGDLLDF